MIKKITRQVMFKHLGYYDDKLDGIWGKKSKEATRLFQSENGLKVDSIYGPKTEKKLKSVYKNFISGDATDDDFLRVSYITREEIACNDHCGYNKISKQLLYNLGSLREKFNKPIYVTSGCRCSKHNKRVGGVKTSRHFNKEIFTKAVDFYNSKTKSLAYRKKVIDFWINDLPNTRYAYSNKYSNLKGVIKKKIVSTMGSSIHVDVK